MRLPTIEIDDRLYEFVKRMKDRGRYKSLAHLVRDLLTKACAPHLIEEMPIVPADPALEWPILDKAWSCTECRNGQHCGGGVIHDDAGEFITIERNWKIRERWICICPQCCQHEMSDDGRSIQILASFPEAPRNVPITGYRPRRHGQPESWDPSIKEDTQPPKPATGTWLEQKKALLASQVVANAPPQQAYAGPSAHQMEDYPKLDYSNPSHDDMLDQFSADLRAWKLRHGVALDPEQEARDERKREILRNAPVQP